MDVKLSLNKNVMQLERTKNSVNNIFWGLINKAVLMLGPFILRTIMINVLGEEYLGLNSLCMSILNVLILTELGFGSALVFSMYHPIAVGDDKKICALLNLYKNINRLIGIIIAVAGLIILPFLKYFIKGSYPSDINIYVVYLFYLVNTVVSYWMFAYKYSILLAFQRTDIISNVSTVINFLLYAIQTVFLLTYKSYYLYVVALPVSTVLNNIVIAYATRKIFPLYRPEGVLEKRETKEIYGNVKAIMGHKFGGTVVTSANNIIISSFLGLTVLALYTNYYYIIFALVTVMSIFSNSILGGLGNRLVLKSREDNLKLFYNLNFMNVWIVGWFSICLLCLLQPFMILWMGGDRLLQEGTVILLTLYFYSWQFRIIGLNYKDAAGMWKDDFWKPYVGAVINLISNFMLVNIIGVNGVLISTILAMVLVYFPWETKVLTDKLFCCSSKDYYVKHVLYFLTFCGIGWFTKFICGLLPDAYFGNFVLKVIFCIIIPNVLFALLYRDTEEFSYMKHLLEGIKSKLK